MKKHQKNIKFINILFKGTIANFRFSDGKITEKCLNYYEEYAKKEIGSIKTGRALTDNNFKLKSLFLMNDEKYISEYKKLISLMHQYDTKNFC